MMRITKKIIGWAIEGIREVMDAQEAIGEPTEKLEYAEGILGELLYGYSDRNGLLDHLVSTHWDEYDEGLLQKMIQVKTPHEVYEYFVDNMELQSWIWEAFGKEFFKVVDMDLDSFDNSEEELRIHIGKFFTNKLYKYAKGSDEEEHN